MTAPNAEPHIGALVGAYRIERELGRGGFGVVFVARHTGDGGAVALKVLAPGMLERAGGVARFRREAELARRLQHPNVVRVLDAGEDAGTHFIAFELLEGRSLEDEIARWGAMPPARAVRMVMDVLAALEAAHAVGIVHRDLKPANVFILHEQDRIKVLDFGIAKSLQPGTLAGLTQEGVAIGTPAYMAPEQVVGGAVGPATDVFAVGVLLIEMLSGRPLYDEHSSPIDILRERLAQRPVPLPPGVAVLGVAPLLSRAVQPRPDDRFQSAAAMRTALAGLLPSLPTAPIGPIAGAGAVTASVGFARTQAPLAVPPTIAPAIAPPVPMAAPVWTPHVAPPTAPAWAPPVAPPTALGPTLAPAYGHPVAAPPRAQGTPWGIVAGMAAFGLVALAASLFAVYSFAVASAPARVDDGTVDDGSAVPTPPTSDAPDSPDTPADGRGEVRPCLGVATLERATIENHLRALGWRVTGESLHCFGDMVNLQCQGPSARGVTVERGDNEGDVGLVRFGSQREVEELVAGSKEGGTALGVGARAVLIVDLPPGDASRLLERVCR